MTSTKAHPPREGTKLSQLLQALKGRGASIATLTQQLGWQPHTVRAAISTLRRRGYGVTLTQAKKTGSSVYRLSGTSA